MAVSSIPLRNDFPRYKFSTTIDDVNYIFSLSYNTRSQRWILEIQDPSGTQIISGSSLVINRDLYDQFKHLDIPQGVLFCLDDTNKNVQPSRYSFGLDHTMVYDSP